METVYKINDEAWDDEAYAPYYSTDSYYGNDDESILGNLGNAIKSGVSAVGNLITGNPLGAAKNVGTAIGSVLGVNPVPAVTAGIQAASNLSGQIQTATGKTVPFKLPETVATKNDINILQGAIQRINGEIKKVADTTTNNGQALTKLAREVKATDDRHRAISAKQNDLIAKLGVSQDKLQKAVDNLKSQSQMSMFLPMMMGKNDEITFEKRGTSGETVVADGSTTYKLEGSDNSSLLFMMMAMSGGFGGNSNNGSSGGSNDMFSNPMMMYFMMEAMK